MAVLNPILQIERTELLLEIERGVALLLFERHGLDKAKAEDIARHYVEELAFMYAGENFTIPMDYIYRRAMIAQVLLKEFDGTNFVKLSRKFRVRVNTVYDIIKRFKRRANITPERTEFMRTCVESIANLMVRKHNFSQPEAEKIGNEVADFIADEFGGIQLVLPWDYSLKTAHLHVELLREFDGSNVQALAEKYQLPVDEIQRALDRYRNLPLRASA